ncbi:hypothetical protein JAF83_002336 [Citrobacter werkmanii]|nr:hypothetical protein [Citrobacter werkmanii]
MTSKLIALALLVVASSAWADMGCTSKDGEQYILSMTLAPQTIEVNSDFFDLQSVKVQKDGTKKMDYVQKYVGNKATLMTKDGYYPVLVKGGKSYPCGR